jgi:hypothetical protein
LRGFIAINPLKVIFNPGNIEHGLREILVFVLRTGNFKCLEETQKKNLVLNLYHGITVGGGSPKPKFSIIVDKSHMYVWSFPPHTSSMKQR